METQIYLFFPLLVFMRRKVGMGSVLLASFAIGFGAFLGTSIYGAHQNTYYYLLVFAFGMLAADVCFGPRRPGSITQIVLASAANALILIAAVISHLHHSTLRETELLVTLFGMSSVYLGSLFRSRILAFSVLAACHLLLLASLIARAGVAADLAVCDMFVGVLATSLFVVCSLSPRALLARFLSSRYLEALGAFSYSLYLIHAPFQQLLWQTFVAPLGLRRSVAFFVMAIGGTAILIAIAYGFFLLFERPFLKRTRVGAMRAEVVAEEPVAA